MTNDSADLKVFYSSGERERERERTQESGRESGREQGLLCLCSKSGARTGHKSSRSLVLGEGAMRFIIVLLEQRVILFSLG